MKNELKKIIDKYSNIQYNNSNYEIGGGLSDEKFASKRHEDAKNDTGKITLGEATQIIKKATKCDTEFIKSILHYAIPYMEWHHAGKLPKQYGGGMKKTYFIKTQELVEVAENWENLIYEVAKKEEEDRMKKEELKAKKKKQEIFLSKYATFVSRVVEKPKFFVLTNTEMNGKHGWFNSEGKNYNLTEYYSGWVFKSKKSLEKYYTL